jgi:hypothetical protein
MIYDPKNKATLPYASMASSEQPQPTSHSYDILASACSLWPARLPDEKDTIFLRDGSIFDHFFRH